jgi:acyl carrier protein
MMNGDIEQQVIEVLRSVKKDLATDGLTRTTLLADAGIDSLDALNILFALEDHFGIVVSDERAHALRTFGDVMDTVVELASARS